MTETERTIEMSNFRVELKKVVDDSYDVQIGRDLIPIMVEDIKNGLAGSIKKFAVILSGRRQSGIL